MAMNPRCSVVVPTHDRRASLDRLLAALARQTTETREFEVVVVLDGCTDGSRQLAERWTDRLRLSVVEQRRAGQARARNAGVAVARGDVVVFLDDDVEPVPDLVASHLAAHAETRAGAPTVVLGDCPMPRSTGDSLYHVVTWQWWEDVFQRRRRPGHVFTYLDCAAGNISFATGHFLAVGGFDARFTEFGGEDYELGWRLLEQGARFVVARDAIAWHHHRGDVRTSVERHRAEGRNDVLFGSLHPEVRHTLRLAKRPVDDVARLVSWSFRAPDLVDRLVRPRVATLAPLERFGARRRWVETFDRLRAYAYWQGVRDRLPTPAAVAAFLENVPSDVVPLALGDGLPDDLPPALESLGRHRVRVSAGSRPVGELAVETPPVGDLRTYLAAELTRHLGPRLRGAAGVERRA